MIFASYAQNYEDLRLWRALGHIKGGCYLDIGAQDPVRDSVSKAFYDAGWRGAHVEATPAYAAALRENRPDERVFEVAIGDQPGPMTFYEFPGNGMSTGIAEIARRHSEGGFEVRMRQVPVVTLSKVFTDFGAKTIHWMKIDVEGMERAVISSWGRSAAKPWVLIIESVHPSTHRPTEGEWLSLILARGYQEVAFDGLSRYFVADTHVELATALATPPNIFDDFRVTRYHFSAQQVVAEENSKIEIATAARAQAELELSASQGREQELLASLNQLSDERAHLAGVQAETVRVAEQLDTAQAMIAAVQLARSALESKLSVAEQQLVARDAELAAANAEISQRRDAAKVGKDQLAGVVARHEEADARARALRESLLADYAELKRTRDNAQQTIDDLISRQSVSADTVSSSLSARIAAIEEQNRSNLNGLLSRLSLSHDTTICPLVASAPVVEDHNSSIAENLKQQRDDPLHSSGGSVNAIVPKGGSIANAASDDYLTRVDAGFAPMTLDDLMELHDDNFVKCAFEMLLKRGADPDDLQYYGRRLRRGGNRIRVLADIAGSSEGRKIYAEGRQIRRAICIQRVRDGLMLRPLRTRLFGDNREDHVISRLRAIEKRVATLTVHGPASAQPKNAGYESDVVAMAVAQPVSTVAEVAPVEEITGGGPNSSLVAAEDAQPMGAVTEAPSALVAVPLVPAPGDVVPEGPDAAPAQLNATMDADGTFSEEQWHALTEGLFQRHWPDGEARVNAAGALNSKSLWVVIVGEKSSTVATETVANLRALRNAATFDVEFGSLGPQISLGAVKFASIEDLAKRVPGESLIMFIEDSDLVDGRLPIALTLDRAWKRDFILSDQAFKDHYRVALVPFHGIDHFHLAHVDYFWSRFLVSGHALRAAAGSGAETPIDVARHVVGALQGKESKLLHLQFPFIGNGALDVDVVRQSRHAVMHAFATSAPASKLLWQASVSVIVNTKDGGYLLDGLVNQLLAMPQIAEILIVSNNSSGDYTLDLLDRLSQTERCSVFAYNRPFNFSEQCNIAVGAAQGRFLLFLNDDISLIGTGWLDRLLADVDVDRPRIAGPLMLYPNQSIQHGGMYLGYNGVAGHTFRHQKHPHGAPMYELVAPRLVSCLTGACLVMPRSIFEDLNGFDEQLATGLQDVDLSLRAMFSGAELIFDPRAIIFHLESVSLIPTLSDDAVQRRRVREAARFHGRWQSELRLDRWHNRNFPIEDESMRNIRIAG